LLEQEATKGKIGTMQSTGRDEATGQELRGLVPLVDGHRRIARIEKQDPSPDYADIGMLGEGGGNLLDIIWCEIAIVIGQADDPTLSLAPAAVTRSAEPDAGLTDDPCIIEFLCELLKPCRCTIGRSIVDKDNFPASFRFDP
jgi:hypothetical protein